MSGYSSDSSDSTEINLSDTSLIAVVNSKVSSYNTETDSNNDASPIQPYQFEPDTELLESGSSEDACEDSESKNNHSDRLSNADW